MSTTCPVSGYLRKCCVAVDVVATSVIQAPKPELQVMRYEYIDCECGAIRPAFPNKSRSVPRVNDRRDLDGISWVLCRPL